MENRPGRLIAVAVLAALLVASLPAAAYPRPGATELLSWRADGQGGSGLVLGTAMTPDGRSVAFRSLSTALVAGPNNNFYDIYVRDRETGLTERVSVSSSGALANGNSQDPAISADGRWVAFASDATNLVEGDTNGRRDVFVHDRETGLTERVSVASDGTQGDRHSDRPAISADGRWVTFDSEARNLTPAGTSPGARQVYLHDRDTGVTTLVSATPDGAAGDGGSLRSALTPDGRYVAFDSSADNLVEDDSNDGRDVFVADTANGAVERVSVASDGTEANGGSQDAAISPDGRWVAFSSLASNLVPGDTNEVRDVFLHDRDSGVTSRVSVAGDGQEADGASANPAVSADGSVVVFDSRATNLTSVPANATADIHWHHVGLGVTERVSLAEDGGQADAVSLRPVISADGRLVVFESGARNLVAGVPKPSTLDAFMRDVGPRLGSWAVDVAPAAEGLTVSGWATFTGKELTSADGPGGDAVARGLGGALERVEVLQRPEEEDLLVRWHVGDLPGLGPLGAGVPGVQYRLAFTAGTGYEIRVDRDGAGLYVCADDCEHAADLPGAVGVTGQTVTAALPLAALDGETLTGLRASTVLAAGPLTLHELAALTLPSADLGMPTVMLGVGPADAPLAGITFDQPAALQDGRFSAALQETPHESLLWIRTCLGDDCAADSYPLP